MLNDILAPLLESEVLTDEVKNSISNALTEAIEKIKLDVKTQTENKAKEQFEKAKIEFENGFKKLEETANAKIADLTDQLKEVRSLAEAYENELEELKSNPFVGLTETDLEEAEATIIKEQEEKYNKLIESIKEEYDKTFEDIKSIYEETIEKLKEEAEIKKDLEEELKEKESLIESYEKDIEELEAEKEEIKETIVEKVKEEYVEKVKDDIASITETFIDQELAELKKTTDELIKESKGRELLENLKDVVKQFWDIDDELAEDLHEHKKQAELKVEQYKDMLNKEHARLEEMRKENEELKRKIIVESKGAILSEDKKETLEKIAANFEPEKLEAEIDTLMESVIDTFNSGFEEEVKEILNESEETIVGISNGDSVKEESNELEDEYKKLLEIAGIK